MEIRVLGPFDVRAPGPAPGAHRGELAALIALAAVLPTGVPASLVSEMLPQPDAVPVAAGQLRDWLGVDANGIPRLGDRSGAWFLSTDVWVDWHVFRGLLDTAGPGREKQHLANALVLIRGELLAEVPLHSATQHILQPVLADLRTVVVNAVRRDIELARAAGDRARGAWALRQGQTLLPSDERLQQIRLD